MSSDFVIRIGTVSGGFFISRDAGDTRTMTMILKSMYGQRNSTHAIPRPCSWVSRPAPSTVRATTTQHGRN
jgi:hypothetical protein